MMWEHERYVRLYTRDTPGWLMMPWQGRALQPLLIRKLDRAGVIDLAEYADEETAEVLAEMVKLPVEVVTIGLAALLKRKTFVLNGRFLVMPNFLDAQEASQSDKARKRTERERARDLANAKSLVVTSSSQCVTTPSQDVTAPSENATPRDEKSQEVTGSHSVPFRTVPSRSEPNQAVPIAAATAPLLRGLQEIETAIRSKPIFESLDAHALARTQAEFMMTAKLKLEWVLEAIRVCAAHHEGQGLQSGVLQRKLVSYMQGALPPRNQEGKTVRKFVECDDRPPTDEEIAARSKAADERRAAQDAERKRREAIDTAFGPPRPHRFGPPDAPASDRSTGVLSKQSTDGLQPTTTPRAVRIERESAYHAAKEST